jgi:hypothetical protein
MMSWQVADFFIEGRRVRLGADPAVSNTRMTPTTESK